MILSPNGEKIDHRKLKEACECFNELIKMQESLDKYENGPWLIPFMKLQCN